MLTVHNDTLRLRYGCLTNSLFNAAAVCNIKHDANDEVQMKCCSNEDLCNKYITVSDFNITTGNGFILNRLVCILVCSNTIPHNSIY